MGSCFGSPRSLQDKDSKGKSKIAILPTSEDERKKEELNTDFFDILATSENGRRKAKINTELLKLFSDSIASTKNMDKSVENLSESLDANRLDDAKLCNDKINCPGNHGLKNFTTELDNYACSECKNLFEKGTTMDGCRICDFDLCTNCYDILHIEHAIESIVEQESKVGEENEDIDENKENQNTPEMMEIKTEISSDELNPKQKEQMEYLYCPVLKQLVKKKNTDSKKTVLEPVLTKSMIKAGISIDQSNATKTQRSM